MTKVPEVKRYLQVAVIAKDGILVVRENIPFQGVCERIIVPSSLIHGLLTALPDLPLLTNFRESHEN